MNPRLRFQRNKRPSTIVEPIVMKRQAEIEPSDEQLVGSYLEGDQYCFEKLYERYKRRLYSYLNRLVFRADLADDIFQQTWIKVVHQLPRYQSHGKFQAWLLTIAHNCAMDHFRKERRRNEVPDEHVSPLTAPDIDEGWRKLDRQALATALSAALAKLPAEQREVFVLRQEGVSFKEIAEIQDCSINTALGRMQYALRGLRKRLVEWNDKGGAG